MEEVREASQPDSVAEHDEADVEETLEASSEKDASEIPEDEGTREEDPTPTTILTVLNPEVSAVFTLNGKQYPVKVGDKCAILDLEEVEPGVEKIVDTILMGRADQTVLGDPFIPDATVVLRSQRLVTKKLISFKKRRRKNSSQRKRGYRQKSTVFVTQRISIPGLPESRIEEAVSS